MNVRSRSGLAARQRLCSLYQPRVPHRHLAMPANVLRAKFSGKDFLGDLNCWGATSTTMRRAAMTR
eukprot:9309010-Alexandrium_andersonii.AAC.1